MLYATFETIYKKYTTRYYPVYITTTSPPPQMVKMKSANIVLYYLLGVSSYLS